MPRRASRQQQGFSVIELVVVVLLVLIVAGFAIPSVMRAVYNIRLRSASGALSGLMQQARMVAAKNNATYPVRYTTYNGARIAYVDLNNNAVWNATVTINGVNTSEPNVEFAGTVAPAAGAPTGGSGEPSAYVPTGDTGTGAFDNTATLAYTPRGLPCNYDTGTVPATCTTPAAKYFVYYLTQTMPIGPTVWAGVVVTKSGRTKAVTWNGSAWR